MNPLHPRRRRSLNNVLRYHDGDADAAVHTLLEDCRHLREQLALTQRGVSNGFARGWTPSFDRD